MKKAPAALKAIDQCEMLRSHCEKGGEREGERERGRREPYERNESGEEA